MGGRRAAAASGWKGEAGKPKLQLPSVNSLFADTKLAKPNFLQANSTYTVSHLGLVMLFLFVCLCVTV